MVVGDLLYQVSKVFRWFQITLLRLWLLLLRLTFILLWRLLEYRCRNRFILDDNLAENSDVNNQFLVFKLKHVPFPLCGYQILLLLIDLNLVLVMLAYLTIKVKVFRGFLNPLVDLGNVSSALDGFFNNPVMVSELRYLPLPLLKNFLKALSSKLVVLQLVLEKLCLFSQRFVLFRLNLILLLYFRER